jgi:hypothetical protein
MSRTLSLAGFQVTFIGRFWVTTEVQSTLTQKMVCRSAQEQFRFTVSGEANGTVGFADWKQYV